MKQFVDGTKQVQTSSLMPHQAISNAM